MWEDIRKQLPGVHGHTYLMNASMGPIHPYAKKRMAFFYKNIEEKGLKGIIDAMDEVELTREKVAKLLNCKSKEIGFACSTSMAMNLIAMLCKALPLPNNKVLTMHDEFPASTLPWVKHGFQVDFMESEHGEYHSQTIAEILEKESPAILVSSLVQSYTGYRQDTEFLGRLAQTKAFLTVINATQGMGVLPTDASGVDFMCASIHKWLMSGFGLSIVKIKECYLGNIPIAGWASQKNLWDFDNNRVLDEIHEAKAIEVGLMPFAQLYALGGVLSWICEIGGIGTIRDRVIPLVSMVKEKLHEAHIPLAYSFEVNASSGILMIQCPCDSSTLVEELYKKSIHVVGKKNLLRLAIHYYNNEEDIDTFVSEYQKLTKFKFP